VDREVPVAGSVADPVVVAESLALDPRDLGLAALDRVEAGERREVAARGGPLADALGGLGGRLSADLSAGGLDEAVPEADVLLLLSRMTLQLVAP
jgi:hypothetical protein